MGANPFDPNDTEPYVPPGQAKTPSVPISGNPFDPAPVNAPPPESLLSNAADVAKAASNTFSMGMRDRLEGLYRRYVTGEAPTYSEGVDQAVADTAMRRERSPYLSVVGDVAGGTAQAYVPGAGAVGRNVSLALGGAGRGAMPATARALGYGIEGGLFGAGQAAGHTYTGKPEDYARNAVIGGALGTVLGAPFGVTADVAPRSTAAIPTSQELKASSKQHYRDTHAVPIEYDTSNFKSMLGLAEQHLYGITNPVKSPTVWETLKYARKSYNDPTVTPKQIDDLRQQLTGVAEPGASQMRKVFDAYMQHPSGVAKGTQADRAAVARSLAAARGDYRAGKRTETIENINQYAADKAASANSGFNVENSYRQGLTSLLNPKSREGRWYTPEEKADIRSTVHRTASGNLIRAGGNLMGGGGGAYAGTLGAGGAAAAFMAGDLKPLIAGMTIPAVGAGLKAYGNRSMVNAAENLADTMAMRSPLYKARAAAAPVVAGPGLSNPAEATRNALTIEMLNQLRLRDGLYGEQ